MDYRLMKLALKLFAERKNSTNGRDATQTC